MSGTMKVDQHTWQDLRISHADATVATAILRASAGLLAEKLRALPYVIEHDGSKWIAADLVDTLADALDQIT